jgi:hypothetical protein
MTSEELDQLIAPFIDLYKSSGRPKTMQRLVDQHPEIFQKLVDAGYTYGEIAALMQKNGVVAQNGTPISEKNWRTKIERAHVSLPMRRTPPQSRRRGSAATQSTRKPQLREAEILPAQTTKPIDTKHHAERHGGNALFHDVLDKTKQQTERVASVSKKKSPNK